jgi:hypothetical protein
MTQQILNGCNLTNLLGTPLVILLWRVVVVVAVLPQVILAQGVAQVDC